MLVIKSDPIHNVDMVQKIVSEDVSSSKTVIDNFNVIRTCNNVDVVTNSEVDVNDTKSRNFFRNTSNNENRIANSDNCSQQFLYPNPKSQPGLIERCRYDFIDGEQFKTASSTNFVAQKKSSSIVSSTTSQRIDKPATKPVEKQLNPKPSCEIKTPEKITTPDVKQIQKTPSVIEPVSQPPKSVPIIKSPTPSNVSTKSNHDTASNAATLRVPNKPAVVNEKPQPAWKTIAPYDISTPVEVIVQYIDQKNPQLLWIMLKKYENESYKMLAEINKFIKTNTPRCSADEIKNNNLVAAPFEDIFYRAVIVDTFESLNEILLRLIDYGNEFYAKYEDIKTASPQMLNIPQYAFQVKLLEKRSIELSETITIKFTSRESSGIWYVSENLDKPATLPADIIAEQNQYAVRQDISTISIPENIPLKLAMLDSSLFMTDRIVTAAVYDEKVILDLEKLNEKFSYYCIEHATKTSPHSPKVGEICCAIFADDGDWYRTECINIVSSSRYLLKFIDYGNYSEVDVDNIREIPREYLFQTSANTCLVEIGKRNRMLMFFLSL